jgi:hypothetical protein
MSSSPHCTHKLQALDKRVTGSLEPSVVWKGPESAGRRYCRERLPINWNLFFEDSRFYKCWFYINSESWAQTSCLNVLYCEGPAANLYVPSFINPASKAIKQSKGLSSFLHSFCALLEAQIIQKWAQIYFLFPVSEILHCIKATVYRFKIAQTLACKGGRSTISKKKEMDPELVRRDTTDCLQRVSPS